MGRSSHLNWIGVEPPEPTPTAPRAPRWLTRARQIVDELCDERMSPHARLRLLELDSILNAGRLSSRTPTLNVQQLADRLLGAMRPDELYTSSELATLVGLIVPGDTLWSYPGPNHPSANKWVCAMNYLRRSGQVVTKGRARATRYYLVPDFQP